MAELRVEKHKNDRILSNFTKMVGRLKHSDTPIINFGSKRNPLLRILAKKGISPPYHSGTSLSPSAHLEDDLQSQLGIKRFARSDSRRAVKAADGRREIQSVVVGVVRIEASVAIGYR